MENKIIRLEIRFTRATLAVLLGSLLLAAGLVVAGGVLAQNRPPTEPPAQEAVVEGQAAALAASAVAPAISYQGRLADAGGNPLDGVYDMEFQLWDAEGGGSQVGATIAVNDVAVARGLFNVRLEVDPADFDGQALWLRVRVREDGGSWDPWMTPRQEVRPAPYALSLRPGAVVNNPSTDAFAEAVVGQMSSTLPGGYSAGVRGINNGTGGLGIGVWGSQDGSGWGVYGEVAGDGRGVYGSASGGGGVGVYARGGGATGTALAVDEGAIRVVGAGPGTDTTVFVHQATAGNITVHSTDIDHPLTNDDPDAILIITQNWNPGGVGGMYNAHPIGVWYDGSHWEIFNQDFAAMPEGAAFNVLVVKP